MEKELKEVVNKFSLPNEIVTVKFIPRKRGLATNVSKDHILSGNMMSKAVKKYYAPLQKNGRIANVLTNEEKEYLEQVTRLNLSSYGDFWETFYVSLRKEDVSNTFDMSNPTDYMSVKLLETIKDEIAPDWESRNNKGSYLFAITRENEIFDSKKSKLDIKKEAFKTYAKLETDKDTLLSILKLIDKKPISSDSSLDWLQGKVGEYVDTEPSKFLNIVNDASFQTKALINKGVDAGIILRKGNKYSTIDGLELSYQGQVPSFQNAVTYLDDPKNQEVRALIEARINNTK
jgi:hypothetical protein